MPCLFHGIEGQRLTVESQERVPLSAVVSIERNDVLFLGEVITSLPTPEGSWRSEVKVQQILSGLQSLMNLRSHLVTHGVGAAPERIHSPVFA